MARIFVVEDDASLREELMRLLELQGHTALTGTAFDRIVDDVLAAAPDCVILDLKLPGTGGHTVCRDLRRSSQVPVIEAWCWTWRAGGWSTADVPST